MGVGCVSDTQRFSHNLLHLKLESPDTRFSNTREAETPHPSPLPRCESLSFSTNRIERLEVPSSQNVWIDDEASGSPSTASTALPYAYDYVAAALQQREGRHAASTTLGNVWSGSKRVMELGGDAPPKGSAMTMNMVGAFDRAEGFRVAAVSSGLRSTWSEGSAEDSRCNTTDMAVERRNGGLEDSAAWLTRVSAPQNAPATTESGGILRASFQGPLSHDDGGILKESTILTADTMCDGPMLKPKSSSLFGVFTSKRERVDSAAEGGRDLFSMRRELLSQQVSGKLKGLAAADLPHIGPSEHSVLGLPHNTTSQLAAAAATVGDNNGRKRVPILSHRSSSGDSKDDLDSTHSKIKYSSSGDALGADAHGNMGGGDTQRDVSATRDSTQSLEWYCSRKYYKYSLQRKSKLRLVVDAGISVWGGYD